VAQTTTAAPGTTITVNTIEDESNVDSDCSMREAIEAADTNTAVDECAAGSETENDAIHFALGKEATITLGSQQLPDITDPSGLTINGQKAKITVSGNDAARVFFVGPGAEFNLRNLTVADGNSASGAGLRNNGGEVQVWNSTFSGNSADGLGGGIFNNGTLDMINSTFSKNSAEFGGGIFDAGGTENSLNNTIVANSTSGGDCGGTITDGGYNIDTDGTCVEETVSTSKTTDTKLDPKGLQDNGGPTQTIALKKNSPAINRIPKGTNACGTEITTDQRGVKRPQGSRCDIGAFEKKQW
jgi:CSLREA domain-containing protein